MCEHRHKIVWDMPHSVSYKIIEKKILCHCCACTFYKLLSKKELNGKRRSKLNIFYIGNIFLYIISFMKLYLSVFLVSISRVGFYAW